MLQDELASALNIKKSQLSKFKARGCPVDDVGKARVWIRANIRPRSKGKAGTGGEVPTEIPPAEVPTPDASHSWEARLERARRMELQIYEAARKAVGSPQGSQLQSLLASYQRSIEGIADLEKTAAAARVSSGELIHRDTVRALFGEVLVPLRNALENLPMAERSRCNPQAPEVAQSALTAWRDTLLNRLSQADTKF